MKTNPVGGGENQSLKVSYQSRMLQRTFLVFRELSNMAPHSEESVTKSTDQAMQKTYENYDTYLKLPSEIGTDYNFKHKVVWFNAIGFLILHLAAVYGVYLCFFTTILSTLYSKYNLTISAQTRL